MEPVAYMDAVDNRLIYAAPKRKRWMSERDDKEWRKFHADNELNAPLYTSEAIEAAVLAEREAIAKLFDIDDYRMFAAAIRARNTK